MDTVKDLHQIAFTPRFQILHNDYPAFNFSPLSFTKICLFSVLNGETSLG